MEIEEEYQFKSLYLEEEFVEVENLLVNTSEFKEYYPDFEKWLNKALDDASKGERLIYAVYNPVILSGLPSLKMDSVAIVKIAGESAELKCLFINKKTDSSDSGKFLYQCVEEQLAKKQISKIITDIPYENKELNWFLIQNGFQINGLIERYKKGNLDYILSKDIPLCYTGDPFDWCGISEWFLEHTYQFKIDACEKQSENLFRIYDLLLTSQNTNISKLPTIKGKAVVCEGELQNEKSEEVLKFYDKINTFGIVISSKFEDACLGELNKRNILSFNRKDIFEQCGCKEPFFEREDIDGIIVEVKQEHFEKITDDAEFFTYVKGAGSGKFARKDNYILFLVDSHKESPYGAVMGLGKIKEISYADPNAQWDAHKELNPIFSQDDYDQFTRYKKEIIAIVVSNFKRISPISYDNFKSEFGEYLHDDKIGNTYVNEDFTTSFLLYISQQEQSESPYDIETKKSGEGQSEAVIETMMQMYNEVRKQTDGLDQINQKLTDIEVRTNQKSGIKQDLVISTGLEIGGTGARHQVTIPIQDIASTDLNNDLMQVLEGKSIAKYPKLQGYLLKLMLDRNIFRNSQ